MKKVKKLWMPLLLGSLLMVTLVGVAGAGPNARPEVSPALVDYTISSSHCAPISQTTNWTYGPNEVHCIAGTCNFHCPIKPPHQGVIRVQRLAMYVFDNNNPGNVCISLGHVYPKTGTFVSRLNLQCTTDNAANPQVYAYNPANFKVSVLQDMHVLATIASTGQKLYGFKLKYEPL